MRKRAFTLIELLVVIAIIAILAGIIFPVLAQAKLSAKRAASLSNIKQIQLAALMYGADYDDNIPIMTNGTWANLTFPTPGNDYLDPLRTKTWVENIRPYVKSYQLFVDPVRGDSTGMFAGPPTDLIPAGAPDGISDGVRTHRNQGRLAMYGFNFMFLSPWALCVFSESRSFTQADDPAGTIMYSQSQIFDLDDSVGYFMVDAPGMWPIIAPHLYYCIIWSGNDGSGNWSRLNEPDPTIEASVYVDSADGSVHSFIDGHAKWLKAGAAANGTNYMAVSKTTGGFWQQGAAIINHDEYMWNLDDNYFCENDTVVGCEPGTPDSVPPPPP
jgi:prepilin-type N-terminal cleavage/methylation domain-containing protein